MNLPLGHALGPSEPALGSACANSVASEASRQGRPLLKTIRRVLLGKCLLIAVYVALIICPFLISSVRPGFAIVGVFLWMPAIFDVVKRVRKLIWYSHAKYWIAQGRMEVVHENGEKRSPIFDRLEKLHIEIHDGYCHVFWRPRWGKMQRLGEGFLFVEYTKELHEAVRAICPAVAVMATGKRGMRAGNKS